VAINMPITKIVSVVTKQRNEKVRCEIHDEGLGVPEQERSKLFTEFANISNKPVGNEQSSTGLGLSIVKKLVELQNGSVGVEFPENKGSIFWFELPVSKGTL